METEPEREPFLTYVLATFPTTNNMLWLDFFHYINEAPGSDSILPSVLQYGITVNTSTPAQSYLCALATYFRFNATLHLPVSPPKQLSATVAA